MTPIANRLHDLLEERCQLFPTIEVNASTPEKDVDGSSSSVLASWLRFFGVAEHAANGIATAFRERLRTAAGVRLRLFDRFDAGEPISCSFVSMLTYQAVFDALAAQALEIAHQLAERMGGRSATERKHDHPFDYVLGYALKWFVLGDRVQMTKWAQGFGAQCAEPGNTNFRGYAHTFQAILDRDESSADRGLNEIVVGHQKESEGRGVFADTEDELLCVWGVGMANLCRLYGLLVKPVPPLIPKELLMP